jgi:hypothetical protein
MKMCGGGELRRKRGGKEDAMGCDNVRRREAPRGREATNGVAVVVAKWRHHPSHFSLE